MARCRDIDVWLAGETVSSLSDYKARLEHVRSCRRCAERQAAAVALKHRLGAEVSVRSAEAGVALVMARLGELKRDEGGATAPVSGCYEVARLVSSRQGRSQPSGSMPMSQGRRLAGMLTAAMCFVAVLSPLCVALLCCTPGSLTDVAGAEATRFLWRDTSAEPRQRRSAPLLLSVTARALKPRPPH